MHILYEHYLQFNEDIIEFKHTNTKLAEAQSKNISLENKQQAKKIELLQNYIRELHGNLNRCELASMFLLLLKIINFIEVPFGQRSMSCKNRVCKIPTTKIFKEVDIKNESLKSDKEDSKNVKLFNVETNDSESASESKHSK